MTTIQYWEQISIGNQGTFFYFRSLVPPFS